MSKGEKNENDDFCFKTVFYRSGAFNNGVCKLCVIKKRTDCASISGTNTDSGNTDRAKTGSANADGTNTGGANTCRGRNG